MNKTNAKKSEPTTEAYSVIIDGQPIVVQATTLDEAIEKAQAEVKAQAQEVDNAS